MLWHPGCATGRLGILLPGGWLFTSSVYLGWLQVCSLSCYRVCSLWCRTGPKHERMHTLKEVVRMKKKDWRPSCKCQIPSPITSIPKHFMTMYAFVKLDSSMIYGQWLPMFLQAWFLSPSCSWQEIAEARQARKKSMQAGLGCLQHEAFDSISY